MQENKLLEIIKNTLNSKYINDDCAYLEDLGIVVTQDSLVEDVHFSLNYTNAFQLGYKSVAVNLSDVYASGAKAKYLTCSLSLPNYIDENFIKEFYEGAKSVNPDVEIVGGDVTGGNKLFISICAIGDARNRKISSRSNAKEGYKIMCIISHKDKLPSDKTLLSILSYARTYFSEYPHHSWCDFNIDTSQVFNAENKDGIVVDYGELRSLRQVA